MSVRIKGRLPRGDRDGLQGLTDRLRIKPAQVVTAVVVFEPTQISKNLDDPDDPTTVTLKILAIEPLDDLDKSAAETLLRVAYMERTGQREVPFGSVFDLDPDRTEERTIDPDTGEISGGGGDT